MLEFDTVLCQYNYLSQLSCSESLPQEILHLEYSGPECRCVLYCYSICMVASGPLLDPVLTFLICYSMKAAIIFPISGCGCLIQTSHKGWNGYRQYPWNIDAKQISGWRFTGCFRKSFMWPQYHVEVSQSHFWVVTTFVTTFSVDLNRSTTIILDSHKLCDQLMIQMQWHNYLTSQYMFFFTCIQSWDQVE